MSLVCYGAYKYWGGGNNSRRNNSGATDLLAMLVNLFAGLIAAYIAWNRNEDNGLLSQIVISVIAFLFGFLYLVYFVGFVLLEDNLFKNTYLLNMPENQLDILAQSAASM